MHRSKKTCSDYENDDDVTKELCELIEPSNENKKCTIKSDNSGCEEVDKEGAKSLKSKLCVIIFLFMIFLWKQKKFLKFFILPLNNIDIKLLTLY